MRRIVTLTLNPALDVSAEADFVVPDRKLRCDGQRLDPGGGGVNVSRAIKRLGGGSTALVALAGATGDLLAQLLKAEGVEVAPYRIRGLTRQSFAVFARDTGRQYRFVLAGPTWSGAEVSGALAFLNQLVGPRTLVVVSGSLPPGVPPEIITEIMRIVRAQNAALFLDTSGPALLGAVRAGAGAPLDFLRMDGDEAEEAAGRVFATPEDLAAYGRSLVEAGVAHHLVLSLGAEGTVGAARGEAFFCRPPLVRPMSAVGAGDSLVGALALGISREEPFRSAVRAGTGTAAAAVTTPATELFDRETARRLIDEVSVLDLAV